jgi:hypothetical protein
LSEDFEELMVERHGTRKCTLFLGPFSELPADADWEVDTLSASTTPRTAMTTTSSLNIAQASDFDLDSHDAHHTYSASSSEAVSHTICVGIKRNNFVEMSDEEVTDEQMFRNHIEISRGKGGMFTRCLYSSKLWAFIRDIDLYMADLFVMVYVHGESDSVDVEQVSAIIPQIELSTRGGSTELRHCEEMMDITPEDRLTPEIVMLIESLWTGKMVWILAEKPSEGALLDALKSIPARVQVYESPKVLSNQLADPDLARKVLQVQPWATHANDIDETIIIRSMSDAIAFIQTASSE